MPIYEYCCSKCSHKFEVLQKMSDKPLSKCEKCGGKVAKLTSLSGFQLKGGGWYADGYSGTKNPADKKDGAPADKSSDKSSAKDKSSADKSSGDTKTAAPKETKSSPKSQAA